MPTFVCYCVFKSHYTMTTSSYNEFGWRDAQPMFYHKLLGKYIERFTAHGRFADSGCRLRETVTSPITWLGKAIASTASTHPNKA
nr:hypothetical protein [Alistipes onderdonkii]